LWDKDGPAAGTQVVEGARLIVIIVVRRSVSARVRLLNGFEFLGVEVRFLQR